MVIIEGLPRYFHSFHPVYKVKLEETKFQRCEACEKSFQELKTRLTTALMLTLPEGTQGFFVCCDASRLGLYYVFM